MPYLRSANVKDGRLVLEDVLSMNFAPSEQATYALHVGDILVTEGSGSRREVGASAQWRGEIPGTVCFQNTLLRIRARSEVATNDFLAVWARHAYRSGTFAAAGTGTNIIHIGLARARAISLLLPPLSEQRRIVDLVAAVDETLGAAEATSAALREVHRVVREALLSGSHEIPESYDRFLAETS